MRSLASIALLGAATIVLTACGGSSDEASLGAAGSSGSAAGASSGSGGSSSAGAGAGAAGSGTAGSGSGQGAGGSGGGTSGAGGASGSSGKAGAAGQGGAAGKGGGAAGTAGSPTAGVPFIVVGKITGASADEAIMIADGVALANTTMATACFKSFVLGAAWTETEGLTQAQIWDKLAAGPVMVDVDLYTGSWYENHVSKTIGYEKEPGVVHMNRYFVDTAYMVADNVIHEAEGHSQGFSHYGVKATSVPYGLNDAFETCSPTGP